LARGARDAGSGKAHLILITDLYEGDREQLLARAVQVVDRAAST